MQALPGGGVKANVSGPPSLFGIAGEILGRAAAQPQQAGGQGGADLAKVGREVDVGGKAGDVRHPLPLRTKPPIRIIPHEVGFDSPPCVR